MTLLWDRLKSEIDAIGLTGEPADQWAIIEFLLKKINEVRMVEKSAAQAGNVEEVRKQVVQKICNHLQVQMKDQNATLGLKEFGEFVNHVKKNESFFWVKKEVAEKGSIKPVRAIVKGFESEKLKKRMAILLNLYPRVVPEKFSPSFITDLTIDIAAKDIAAKAQSIKTLKIIGYVISACSTGRESYAILNNVRNNIDSLEPLLQIDPSHFAHPRKLTNNLINFLCDSPVHEDVKIRRAKALSKVLTVFPDVSEESIQSKVSEVNSDAELTQLLEGIERYIRDKKKALDPEPPIDVDELEAQIAAMADEEEGQPDAEIAELEREMREAEARTLREIQDPEDQVGGEGSSSAAGGNQVSAEELQILAEIKKHFTAEEFTEHRKDISALSSDLLKCAPGQNPSNLIQILLQNIQNANDKMALLLDFSSISEENRTAKVAEALHRYPEEAFILTSDGGGAKRYIVILLAEAGIVEGLTEELVNAIEKVNSKEQEAVVARFAQIHGADERERIVTAFHAIDNVSNAIAFLNSELSLEPQAP